MLAHSVTETYNENLQLYDYKIVCIFAFIASIHCTLCRDCNHICQFLDILLILFP